MRTLTVAPMATVKPKPKARNLPQPRSRARFSPCCPAEGGRLWVVLKVSRARASEGWYKVFVRAAQLTSASPS